MRYVKMNLGLSADVLKAGLITAGLMLPYGLAGAQSFPAKPVKIVVPWSAGSSADVVTRLVSSAMGVKLRGTFVVENKIGATGAIGANSVATSPADGYTLLSVANVYIMGLALQGKPFDFKNEWASIGMMALPASVLVVNPKAMPGVKDFSSLGAFAKANPNMEINYGSSGTGSRSHLAMFMLSKRLGLNSTHIPYKGQAQATTDLVAGRLSAMILDYGANKSQIAAGAVLPIMVVMPKRLSDLPGVPVARELGLQELESMNTTFGLVAPKGTPTAITNRLSDLVRDAVAEREVQEDLRKFGNEPQYMDSATYGASLDDLYGKILKIVQENGIKPD